MTALSNSDTHLCGALQSIARQTHTPISFALTLAALPSLERTSPGKALLGAIEIATAAGNAVIRDLVDFEQAYLMLDQVVNIFRQLPDDAVQKWLMGRDRPELAIQRDFVIFHRHASPRDPQRSSRLLNRFKEVVSEKSHDQEFNIISDTIYRFGSEHTSVTLEDIIEM